LVRVCWASMVMKNSRRQGSRAAKQKVVWEKESPPDAWCRDGSVDSGVLRRGGEWQRRLGVQIGAAALQELGTMAIGQ
jgi:hypothetical protein